jgi:ankyrin repeat protein
MSSTWWLAAVLAFVVAAFAGRGLAAGDNPLVTAARDGDLETVRSLIASHADVNAPARDGSSALLWAVYNANLEMTRALIAAGAAVDTPNRFGVTPLLQASRTGDATAIAALLKAGARVSHAHPDGETPLMAAARSGHLDAVELLLETGADVNAADRFQEETALMWAAAEGHADVVAALVKAGADANRQASVTGIKKREHADHPTGGMTALMFAVRNGYGDIARALIEGGADPTLANGDNATASIIAIVNDRFDLAKMLLDLGSDPNDGSLYFAVDMHDATTDMRARDGSRLRAIHDNTLTSIDLIALLLDRGADPNKAFVGQLHSTSLCCGEDVNASPFYRAAIASDVEVLKMMLARGAQIEWSPSEVKKEGDKDAQGGGAQGRGANANVGRTALMMALVGGRGAPFGGGPGFNRTGPPPFRETGDRQPLDAVTALLAAGADPNVKAPDGSTPLHQAVTARQVAIIRALVAGGARLDAVNKDNVTPLQLAENPPKPNNNAANMDPDAYRPPQDSREDVVAALRELMGLGPTDPTPVPPPAATDGVKNETTTTNGSNGGSEKKPADTKGATQ